MEWTEVHLDQLAADIAADPTLSTLPHNGDSAVVVAHAYNLAAAPDFWVWRTSLGEQEVYEATVDGTQHWNWQTFKGQTVADKDAWARMWAPGVVNPSLGQTRDGWLTIFGGQGTSQVQVNYLLALGRRKATRTEKLYADTAQGVGTTAAPATMVFEGMLTPSLVEQAWAE
jgi:hypothetical protein